MSDLAAAQAEWADWVARACAALDVDPALVDVPAIHALTKQIAHRSVRPMAPVGAFIVGVALGQSGGEADPTDLAARIEALLPPPGRPPAA
ncbi:MAG TPA: DUF6457 domain-containing protein [Dermatophilaceae bacterium]|nr:DUF6457 domain-containing protein [Dermatophilaceae bacterium]